MNKRLIAERFSKAITTYPKEANVQRQIAGKMIRLLTEHIPSPCSKVIEFGCGTGIYSRMLLQALRPEELLLNDKMLLHSFINLMSWSISCSVMSAVSEKRIREVPSGTVGGRTGNA